jgi:hypothetical protein
MKKQRKNAIFDQNQVENQPANRKEQSEFGILGGSSGL